MPVTNIAAGGDRPIAMEIRARRMLTPTNAVHDTPPYRKSIVRSTLKYVVVTMVTVSSTA